MLVRPLIPSQMPKLLGNFDSSTDAKLMAELAEFAQNEPSEASSWLELRKKSDLLLLEETMRLESGGAGARLNPNQKIGACLISSLGSIAVHDLDCAITALNKARRLAASSPQSELDRHAVLESIGLTRELVDELEVKLRRYKPCL